MKTFLKVILILFLAVVVFIVGVFAIALFTVSSQTTNAEVEFGDDIIPTLYSVVGERKVVSSGIGNENGIRYTEYTYDTNVVSIDDIRDYVLKLQEEGFVVTKSEDGMVEIAIESKDAGDLLFVQIDYSTPNVNIMYQKTKGTLTRY